ncbi:hypothetical protein FA13DRAFT_1729825, partial [Coprinellus micaceus]
MLRRRLPSWDLRSQARRGGATGLGYHSFFYSALEQLELWATREHDVQARLGNGITRSRGFSLALGKGVFSVWMQRWGFGNSRKRNL